MPTKPSLCGGGGAVRSSAGAGASDCCGGGVANNGGEYAWDSLNSHSPKVTHGDGGWGVVKLISKLLTSFPAVKNLEPVLAETELDSFVMDMVLGVHESSKQDSGLLWW
jgi:hypothetical protein